MAPTAGKPKAKRGRPKGSKNKPKTVAVATKVSPGMKKAIAAPAVGLAALAVGKTGNKEKNQKHQKQPK